MNIRRASERGHADHGWLRSFHTFSFADYHDPRHMGFRALRVINEDWVQPGQGFGMHPHRDMEIVTYVLEGALEHRDSLGTGSVIRPGDVQRMSAGTGILHSEFNHSKTEPVHLLQIWLLPEEHGITPSYEERRFGEDHSKGPLQLVVSRGGANGALSIHQDVDLYVARPTAADEVRHTLRPGRGAWVQVTRGDIEVNGQALATGDAAAIEGEEEVILTAAADAEALLFDLR